MKYNHIISITFFVAVGVYGQIALGQKALKREVEERIKLEEMPDKAVELLAVWLEESKRSRFYHETDGRQQSYEAKLTHKKRRFSIEFDTNGNLQDVEEWMHFEKLPHNTQDSIALVLEEAYDKYKIRRVQRQFVPQENDEVLLELIRSSTVSISNSNYVVCINKTFDVI